MTLRKLCLVFWVRVNIISRHLLYMSNSQKVAILFMPVLIDDLHILDRLPVLRTLGTAFVHGLN